MTHALVTGASGFIGQHVVKLLREQGQEVSCLVRADSNRCDLEAFHPNYCIGDVTDLDSLRRAMIGIDVVYHLAGLTKSFRSSDYFRINATGTRNVAQACSECDKPPILLITSSLAAAGPANTDRPRREEDALTPVSIYGKSKLAGEEAATEFADRVPITILRPPIVFGQGDVSMFNVFQVISQFGLHLTPGFRDHLYSSIHAADLASAMTIAAEHGSRIEPRREVSGVYFAADPQTVTYAELGRMIGRCLGRPNAWVVRPPKAAIWAMSVANEITSRVRRQPHILNLDKAREATAGSWACSTDLLSKETGFSCAYPLEDRINQTVDWYVSQGWLKRKVRKTVALPR